MTIAKRLTSFLDKNNIQYDVISHPYSEGALNTAHSACIPSHSMAKAVILKDDEGLVLAALPASNKLMLNWLNQSLDRHLRLVEENSLGNLFSDCEPGAIPAMGQPWGMMTACDSDLDTVTDIYIEAGNHRELIRMHRTEFQKLMSNQAHGTISCSTDEQDAYKGSMIPDFV
ncbi:aminoacyl-tRNA deacylase [Parendozoicomonas haliclonae]|uniref:YbaK / prolyl-tRNA synthetases associated domain protein n=1 Tax=Parendozoicomonas haliclonae TaxID=1960125 RepID=A0A1X7AIG1_9GAMM|nr:YbaK/EbsC family protein [Parendozoicomonas haliclonae]SMA43884.1 YbaK / prolyl-tRNA synthetases associated domain protein [Parendozoicomonas haliclonae]